MPAHQNVWQRLCVSAEILTLPYNSTADLDVARAEYRARDEGVEELRARLARGRVHRVELHGRAVDVSSADGCEERHVVRIWTAQGERQTYLVRGDPR